MHWFLNMAEGIPKVEFCLFILRSICHPPLFFFVKRGYEIKANTTMVVSKERRKRLKTKKKKTI